MSFIAIDLGTSFVKGAILDLPGRRFAHVRRAPFPAPMPGLPPGHVEIDPLAVVAAVAGLIDQLKAEAGPCQGIVLCGQMGGVILVDAQGRPLTNYRSWCDQCATEPAGPGSKSWLDLVAERLTPKQFAELGNELRPGSSAALLFWLSQQNPSILRGAIPLSLSTFVGAQLAGAPAVEHPTQLIGSINVRTGDWHHEAFAALGLDALAWPRIEARSREAVGTVRIGNEQIPCYPALGDHQCALLGMGIKADELSINVSTGSQVSRLARTVPDGSYQLRHYFDGWLLQTITHLPAGRSLDGLVALLTEIPRAQGLASADPWNYIIEQSTAAADSTLAANLAFFAGPLGSEGSLTGIKLENLAVGDLFRAVAHNMASNYVRCAQQLAPAQDWKRIVFSGGLANRWELLRSLVLEKLPGPFRLCDQAEDTLTGLLAYALAQSGEFDSALAASAALRNESPHGDDRKPPKANRPATLKQS